MHRAALKTRPAPRSRYRLGELQAPPRSIRPDGEPGARPVVQARRPVDQRGRSDYRAAIHDGRCFYRAMDWPLQIRDGLENEVLDLLNLEVDLPSFDYSPISRLDQADEPVPCDERGRASVGKEGREAGPAPTASPRTTMKDSDALSRGRAR